MAETHEVAAQDDSGGRVDVGADVDWIARLSEAFHCCGTCFGGVLVARDRARAGEAEAAVERVRAVLDDQSQALIYPATSNRTEKTMLVGIKRVRDALDGNQ